jgi:phospholipid-binding lipoprotein MlaA
MEPPLRPRRLIALVGLGALALAGEVRAATPGDPFEATNRKVFSGSDNLSRKYLKPFTRLYRALTPGPIGVGLHNFFVWMSEPAVVVNDVLQVRVQPAANDLARLVTNATFAGFVDIAVTQGLPHHDNDFGITLGRWGVKPGAYLFLPLIGPTTMRDAIGMGADAAMSPLNFMRFPGRLTLTYTTTVMGGLDNISGGQDEFEAATSSAADPYATLRSLYLQSREAAVRGEAATPVLQPLDEAPPADGKTSEAGKPGPSAHATPPPAVAESADCQHPAADDLDAPIATARLADRAGAALGA